MKKTNQVLVLAASLVVSGVVSSGAMADSMQRSAAASGDSLGAVMRAAEILSTNSVKVSQGSVELSGKALTALVTLASDSAKSASNGMSAFGRGAVDATSTVSTKSSASLSAAAEFTVQKVESAVSGSFHHVKVSLRNVVTGVEAVAHFTFDISKTVGHASANSASNIFQVSKTIVLATSNAGVVLVTEGINGTSAVLSGDIKAGSSTIIASFGKSARTFESKMVEGSK